ncbi:MAG: hypothetical protein JXR44_09730 [Thiotrichales bacterium]|nr:hypothetical protein [Thiotrichales bacterium]
MQANIKGLVDRLELGNSKAMMPLFEAISNSMDAIEECGDGYINHSILIEVFSQQDLITESGDTSLVVDGFKVLDDGVGFTDKNTQSFREAHTFSKISIGGKGVGRFTLLKVFSDVHIRSVFECDEKHCLREFVFSIENELKGADNVQVINEPRTTQVSARRINSKYQKGWPSDIETIAERIVTHFLIRFAARSCPPMKLESKGMAELDLHKFFNLKILNHIQEQTFEFEKYFFGLQAYRHKDGRSRHVLHLCANGREVITIKLRDILPELPDKFTDEDGKPYTLIVLVTGEYLDAKCNLERTKISFALDNDLDIEEGLINQGQFYQEVMNVLRPLLVDDLKATNDEKIAQIERFVENAPEYRALMSSRYQDLVRQKIQPGLNDEKLDEALLHVRREIEDGVRKELRDVAALFEKETFEQYQARFQEVAEKANEIGKAQLASYVAHRRTILDLLNNSLKKSRSDDRYPLEKVLHKMIFPMGETSKDVFFEQQNLWVIDERLSYHTLLTSDKKLKSIQGLEGTSGKEPDIFAFFYDSPIGLAEMDGLSGGGIVIIEFKRPGRDDYDRDPADQVIQRFREISEGNVKNIDGRIVNPAGLRFTGYLIADLTPSLRKQVYGRYEQSTDNEGYFSSLSGGNGYIEIISYDKLINDALKRNRILFDKLGLHKSLR